MAWVGGHVLGLPHCGQGLWVRDLGQACERLSAGGWDHNEVRAVVLKDSDRPSGPVDLGDDV